MLYYIKNWAFHDKVENNFHDIWTFNTAVSSKPTSCMQTSTINVSKQNSTYFLAYTYKNMCTLMVLSGTEVFCVQGLPQGENKQL
jgi:hypothetical protein